MLKHVNITITGKVQGVGFRYSILDEAVFLGLKGFVKNIDKGVYAEAEGEEDQLKQLLKYCKAGPKGARVEAMTYEVGELKNFEDFKFEP
ncbi:MAG TPA: acylphosphatase [Patescibacteria group bacterium]|nr:acylphosphatase [Patescibacteria group bacterium]